MRRLLFLLVLGAALTCVAATADAQYMYLDANGDGVWSTADRLNPNGTPTNVRVFVVTDRNRDGSTAVCNTESQPLTINSYAINLVASGGVVSYSGFVNRQASMTQPFGQQNSGNGEYNNGFGGQTILNPGTYHLADLTITGLAGSPSIQFVDIIAGSVDFTHFGTRCSGFGVDNTYKLDGPQTRANQGTADWFDADGLLAGGQNSPPILAPIGNKSGTVGGCGSTPVTFTATATDPDAGQTLTFSLGAGAPSGATISPSSGAFSWQPTTPGIFSVTVIVTDNGIPALSDSETIQISIAVVNQAPVLAAIGNKTVDEGSLLSFVATASSACPGPLTFVLGAGAPPGAAITAGGAFTWTPTEAQGPGTFPITVLVSDGSSTDSETIQVTVREVNQGPVLAPIGNRTTPVGSTLTFTATATDADLPPNNVTFSLGPGAPLGATIQASGAFSWFATTTGTFPITVVATDNGSPPLSDSETINVTVCDCPNTPPVLAAIGDKAANEQVLLTFTATATDVDAGQVLTFSLAPGMPPGSTITPGGTFRWIPAESQGGIIWPVTVVVTDNGPGNRSDSETIHITVIEDNIPPVMTQPASMTVVEGGSETQSLVATDADIPANTLTFSKVTGPVFVTVSSGGLVSASPAVGDAGTYTATVRVSDGSANDTKSFTITVTPLNQTPVADAGGPYTGVVGAGIAFDGSGSSDPNGSPLTYSWSFGDGVAGSGVSPVHAYTTAGTFTVTLTVSDGVLSDSDTSTASILEFFPANVFVTGGNKTVRLGSGKPQTCVQIEPLGGVDDASDIDLSSIRMLYGFGEIPAISGKTTVGDDKNQNGVPEITACFSKENLRVLFAGLATNDIEVVLRGDLVSGGTFQGTVVLHVVNNGNFLAASISPNPLNPKATLSFATSKAGAVRVQMFDVQGRLIRTLVENPNAAAGDHDVTIDGQDEHGVRLASGVYYLRVQTVEGSTRKAITILK